MNKTIIFIGESNLRDAYETYSTFDILKPYHEKFTICAKGGRRLSHLPSFFPSVANFKYICISLRGNDLSNRSVDEMLIGIAVFKYLPASWPKQILRDLELFYRGDQTEEPLLSKLKNSNERSKIEFKAEYYPYSRVRANAFPDLVIASI